MQKAREGRSISDAWAREAAGLRPTYRAEGKARMEHRLGKEGGHRLMGDGVNSEQDDEGRSFPQSRMPASIEFSIKRFVCLKDGLVWGQGLVREKAA